MILLVQTCLTLQRRFLMPNAKAGSCEKSAPTMIQL
jgi:hypothetical protein